MDTAVDLQKIYWGDDMSAIVPAHMLLSIARYGGHVHGAFDGEKMVGMLLGFLGADINPAASDSAPQKMLVMSKRMVVQPQYRGQKIGENLKLAQREFAIDHNIQLVTWTFDPLLSRNAYLNLHKLAGIGQQYKVDYFGSNASDPTLSGDRLVVNWWVNHPQTTQNLNSERTLPETLTPANQTAVDDRGFLTPVTRRMSLAGFEALTVEIPYEFVPLERNQPQLASRWRDHIRDVFQALLKAGYIAVDFTTKKPKSAGERPRSYYIFTPHDGTFTFR
jgi:predicted GNAT superfamily acetyltransferase